MKIDCRLDREEGVSTLVEYLMITAILITLLIITMLVLNTVMMQEPSDRLNYYAFTDISNGVSTRIVDVYVVAPFPGSLSTKINLPEDVAGKSYYVDISSSHLDFNGTLDEVVVSKGSVNYHASLAGIGSSLGVEGNTTGSGLNRIRFKSVANWS
jgi:hypothetical protein